MANLDSSRKFDNKPYARRVEKPWGWEIHWVSDDKPYMGKILHINAGQRISLQYHDKKQESWFLMSGKAKIICDDGTGKLAEMEMKPNYGYSVNLMQKHRLTGLTDCDIIEVSTPEIGITHRLEDDYERAGRDEDSRERELRNGGEI